MDDLIRTIEGPKKREVLREKSETVRKESKERRR